MHIKDEMNNFHAPFKTLTWILLQSLCSCLWITRISSQPCNPTSTRQHRITFNSTYKNPLIKQYETRQKIEDLIFISQQILQFYISHLSINCHFSCITRLIGLNFLESRNKFFAMITTFLLLWSQKYSSAHYNNSQLFPFHYAKINNDNSLKSSDRTLHRTSNLLHTS